MSYEDYLDADPGPEQGSAPDEGPVDVHPDQTSIPAPNYKPGELGPCYWCGDPATYGRIDIGLPKRPHQPRILVQACAHHYRVTVQPALIQQAADKEAKRVEGIRARHGL